MARIRDKMIKFHALHDLRRYTVVPLSKVHFPWFTTLGLARACLAAPRAQKEPLILRMYEGRPSYNPMKLYAATRRLGPAHAASSCEATAHSVALLSNASRMIAGARGQQLLRELNTFRARHVELNCSSSPPPLPPPVPPPVPPSPPPPPPPPPPPDPAAACRSLLQAMDDGQALVDEADHPAWLQQDCNARMLVGRGALATTLVDASETAEGEAEAAGEAAEGEAEAAGGAAEGEAEAAGKART